MVSATGATYWYPLPTRAYTNLRRGTSLDTMYPPDFVSLVAS